ncbi:MAG: hypothetical protein WBN30_16730 [Polyangiales bacterium]
MSFDDGNPCTAARKAMAVAALDSRMSSRRQRTRRSELCRLGHLRDHRGSHLATDNVSRNDNEQDEPLDRSA